MTLRVAVCDPSEISRIGIAHALLAHGIEVVGHGPDVERLAPYFGTVRVVLVDIGVEPFAETVRALTEDGAKVIATGVLADADSVVKALRAGASGYLTKDLPVKAWAKAIEGVLRGEAALSRSLTMHLLDIIRAEIAERALADIAPSERRLTRREWEVLGRIAEGTTNREVATQLHISLETVRSHVSSILAKLEAPNRAAAAAKYYQIRGSSSG